MIRHPARLFVLLAALPLGGCIGSCDPVTTPGELGVAQFEWAGCEHAMFEDCPLVEGVAVGSIAGITVYNRLDLPDFSVASTDTTVATFEWDGTAVLMHGKAAGSVQLELYRLDDETLLDRVTLHVEEVADIGMVSPETDWTLALMPGGPITARFEPLNAGGVKLVGTGALDYVAGSGLSVSGSSTPGQRFEEVSFQATLAGRSTLTVSGGSGSRELIVAAPRPDQVGRVSLGEGPVVLTVSGSSDYSYLWATVTLGDGSVVYRPSCSWSSSASDCVTVEDDTGLYSISGCSGKITGLRRGCSATITATVGSTSGSVSVETE